VRRHVTACPTIWSNSGTIEGADDTGRERSSASRADAEGATSPEPLRPKNRAGQAL